MSSSFFKSIFSNSILTLAFLLIIIFISSQVIISGSNSSNLLNNNIYLSNSSSSFIWPLPGHSFISSYFGYRNSPTAGASFYHSGIDIPAVEGTSILCVCSGKVTFASWGAGGGYTIVVNNNELNISISYCHVSPIFNVYYGELVNTHDVLGFVGPVNVYGIFNNQYKDVNGKPTNGATTGSHLHLTIKKDGRAVNPLNYVHP